MNSNLLRNRTKEIADARRTRLCANTDRLFILLMGIQFVAGVIVALVVSPRAWRGMESTVHVHVYAALGIGGLLASLPIYLAIRQPGSLLTRHVVGASQILFSVLFIHLTGGRIETHFHVFGSLAFLAFYRDWRVLVLPTVIIAADHFIRGLLWPESVFGVIAAAPWRAFEHAGWVLFEDVFLVYSCVHSAREMTFAAERQAQLEYANASVESKIEQRTKELAVRTWVLEEERNQKEVLEFQLLQAQKLESIGQLAAGIAHEINTPAQYVNDNTRYIKDEFANVMRVLDQYAELIAPDEPAREWGDRVEEIKKTLSDIDYEFLRREIPEALSQSLEGLDRITNIVGAMKEFSHPGSVDMQPTDLNKAISSTVVVCTNRWKYAADLDLDLDEDLPAVPCLAAEFNQVLLNLIVNASDAIRDQDKEDGEKGQITVRSRVHGEMAEISVRDNGCGIPPEIMNKIYDPFFTTKAMGEGTGQGLAISRDVVVKKLHGELSCESVVGEGTTFTIRLPLCDTMKKEAAA